LVGLSDLELKFNIL